MKNKIKISIIFLFFFNISKAQHKNVCYTVYQNIKDKTWTNPHWFEENKVTFTSKITYYYIEKFTVRLPNGDQILSNDTVTYRKEYLDQLKALNTQKDGDIDPISVREYSSTILRRHNNLDKTKYLVIDTLVEMGNWKITQDTATILGFLCQKAITTYKGRKVVAYFTAKLPFPAGPRNYRGLPGLILSATNEAGTEGYTAIEIQYPFKGKVPALETDGIAISQKEYQILVDKSNADVFKNISNLMANPQQLIKN
jgi:GLPGLI family protein